jgi:hypothetical protein
MQKSSDQKVICGICKRSTQVPSMNIVNTITKGFRDVSKGTLKVYYDLTKSPYVTCPRCNTNMAVDIKAQNTPPEMKENKEVEGEPGADQIYRSLPCSSCGMILHYVPPQFQRRPSSLSSSSISLSTSASSSLSSTSGTSESSTVSSSTMASKLALAPPPTSNNQVEGTSISKAT